jgi:hypothetical protein
MSCRSRRATNRGYAYVVAPGEFKERSALRAASGGFTAKSDNRTIWLRVALFGRSKMGVLTSATVALRARSALALR